MEVFCQNYLSVKSRYPFLRKSSSKDVWQGPKYSSENKYRRSCLEVLCKKGVLKNFAKFTGKHLRQSLFLNTYSKPAKTSDQFIESVQR